jgi:hypothetical protein
MLGLLSCYSITRLWIAKKLLDEGLKTALDVRRVDAAVASRCWSVTV